MRRLPVQVPFTTPEGERKQRLISQADKDAWHYLFVISKGGREQIVVTGKVIGFEQGTSDRAGRQRILNLIELGFVRQVDYDELRGTYTLEIFDPRDVAKAWKVHWDPQLRLPYETSDEEVESVPSERGDGPNATAETSFPRLSVASEPVDVRPPGSQTRHGSLPSEEPPPQAPPRRLAEHPAQDPPRVPPPAPSEKPSASLASASSFSKPSEKPLVSSERKATESAGGGSSAGASAEPVSMRDALRKLAGVMAVRDPEADRAQIEQLVAWMRSRVADPKLVITPCLRVARAIVALKRVKVGEVELILKRLDKHRAEGTLGCPPSAYFIIAVKRLFSQHSLKWSEV